MIKPPHFFRELKKYKTFIMLFNKFSKHLKGFFNKALFIYLCTAMDFFNEKTHTTIHFS